MDSLAQAQAKLLAQCVPLPSERVELSLALGRVLREDLRAQKDRPQHARAAMDGYALRVEDLNRGGRLELQAAIFAGLVPQEELQPGRAVPVSTGARIPRGADTVLRKEWAQLEGKGLRPLREASLGRDIRAPGEEWRRGDCLIPAGTIVDPSAIAVASANESSSLLVGALPKVRVLSSGDEIRGDHDDALPDSNGPFLRAFCQARGLSVQGGEVLPDEPQALQTALAKAFADVDLLITSGGMSVGERDGMVKSAKAMGGSMIFQGVLLRPGRPIGAAKVGKTLWLMLPGSPGAVLAGAELLLAPLLEAMGAAAGASHAPHRAMLSAPQQGVESSFARWRPVALTKAVAPAQIEELESLSPHHLLTPLRCDGFALLEGKGASMVQYYGRQPQLATVPCMAITGPSGSGKTTLIRKILAHLAPKKRICVIKHSHHPVPAEAPHKDTARFLQEGAHCVFFVSDSDFVVRSQAEPWDRLRMSRWASALEPRPDLVIIEGFSSFAGPRLEVLGPQDPRQAADIEAQLGPQAICACVLRGREIAELDVPCFDSEAIEEIAQWMLASRA